MKIINFWIWSFIILLTYFSCTVFAEERNVSFNWTMNDTTGVISYKLYYSYDQNIAISDATWHSDCETPAVTASVENSSDKDFVMQCNNIPIDKYPVYFQIAAVTAEKEVFSETFTLTVPSDMLPTPPSSLTIIE